MIVACDMNTGIELTAYYIPNYLEISQWNKPALILLYPVFDLRRLFSVYDLKKRSCENRTSSNSRSIVLFWKIFLLPQIEMCFNNSSKTKLNDNNSARYSWIK